MCNGGIVVISKDCNNINNDVLFVIKNDLRKNYNIIENVDIEKLNMYTNNITEKTILFITDDISKYIKKRDVFNYNNNVIIIFIIKHVKNNSVFYNNRILLHSNLYIILENNKLNFIKNRYASENDTIDISNLSSKIRKSKLLKISSTIL